MSLGYKLKEARKNKGLTQEEAAKRLGITFQALSNYERNYRDPDTDTLTKMAEIYEVSTDYLLSRTDIRNESASIEKVKSAISDDPELLQFWEELIQRDDLKVLMRQVRDLPPDGIKRIIRYIKIVEDEEAAEEI